MCGAGSFARIAALAGGVGRRLASPGVLSAERGGRAMPQAVSDEGVAGDRSEGYGVLHGVPSIERHAEGRCQVRNQKPLQQ